jgi:hypothetical protein
MVCLCTLALYTGSCWNVPGMPVCCWDWQLPAVLKALVVLGGALPNATTMGTHHYAAQRCTCGTARLYSYNRYHGTTSLAIGW